jgi:2-keto-3-deoxy-L-rhamnonate aldolase RhmA
LQNFPIAEIWDIYHEERLSGTARSMPDTFISSVTAAEKPLLGCSITIGSLTTAKIIARAGYQWVLIEMEHSPNSPEMVTNMVHAVVAASGGTCFPIIRIPSHGVEWIKWALDSGAAGIIIPMVNTAAEMKEIAKRALYPPIGERSFGPANAAYASIDAKFTPAAYLQQAQAGGIAIIPMIESKEGLGNVEEILAVQGVNAAFIGPQDLRLSLQLPSGRDGNEPEFQAALQKIMLAGKKLKIPVGSIGVGADVAKFRSELGMKFLLCGLDRQGFTNGIAQMLNSVQQMLDE